MHANMNIHRVTKIEVFTPVQAETLNWRERDVYIWQGDRLAMVVMTDANLWDKFSIEDFNSIDCVIENGPGSRHARTCEPSAPVEVTALTTKISLKREQSESGLTKWVTLTEHSALTGEKVTEITMFATTQDIEVIWCYEVEEVQR